MVLIYHQILLYFSMILILFLPGYFLLSAIEARKKLFSSLERLIISFGFSIIITDFLLIILGKSGILITKLSVLLTLATFFLSCISAKYLLHTFRRPVENVINKNERGNDGLFRFSKHQTALIILILFLTVFIKTAYLTNSIFPTSTDLGHHMYWSKSIAETGELPVYEKSEITSENGIYQISKPQKIADFIIGEHLIFSAISLISGANFISFFPSLTLLLINIMSLLAIFILTLRLFKDHPQGKNIAVLTLFIIGPLYAVSSPQAKFVSGGVIGNILGNLFIPLVLYLYYRAFSGKKSVFLTLALFITAGLFYTHHLSSFIFIFIFAFSAIIFAILNIRQLPNYVKEWAKLIFSPSVIFFLIFASLFLIFIYAPNYLDKSAIDTAIGAPEKATRTGLTFTQLKFTSGEARMALGIIGVILLLLGKNRKTYQSSFILGWTIALLIMSLKPGWLFIDIPSNRIGNYISFPLAILAAYTFIWIFDQLKNGKSSTLNPKLLYALFFILYTFLIVGGFYDNSQSLNAGSNSREAVQTFHASSYLAAATNEDDVILKDHNYITADSWIKLYFMRDYNYPFSRGFFKRYEDATKQREMCTLWMISTPNLEDGQKCYNETGVDFVMVDPQFDSAQFQKSKDFDQIYANNEINIYHRHE